jgi:hypothetical protein
LNPSAAHPVDPARSVGPAVPLIGVGNAAVSPTCLGARALRRRLNIRPRAFTTQCAVDLQPTHFHVPLAPARTSSGQGCLGGRRAQQGSRRARRRDRGAGRRGARDIRGDGAPLRRPELRRPLRPVRQGVPLPGTLLPVAASSATLCARPTARPSRPSAARGAKGQTRARPPGGAAGRCYVPRGVRPHA